MSNCFVVATLNERILICSLSVVTTFCLLCEHKKALARGRIDRLQHFFSVTVNTNV